MPGILPKTAKLIDLRNAKSVLTFESLFENREEVEELYGIFTTASSL
ncbi:hypothetical protein HMPREF1987_01366 [Peptostreptococcaceae bacterium oral taxon 113 str. W5053]|nr:hypothetical protein HMPREF1987_01366 [Peptostreptococcaceae bacterium oral taxon 113 str. W5053]